MRFAPRCVGWLWAGTVMALLLTVAGCGTLDSNLHIAYHPDGSARAAIHIEGTETLALELLESGFDDQLRGAGWEITVTDNGAYVVVAGAVERQSMAAL